MGFFSRRTAEKAGRYAIRQNTVIIDGSPVVWQPDGDEVEACPGYLMEDECAGDYAFGARFRPADGTGSSLTIWAFPAEVGPATPGCWFVGYKTEYAVRHWRPGPGHAAIEWGSSLYHGDVYLAQWYEDLSEATEAARTAAAALIMAGPGAAGQHVSARTVTEWFSWDGQPW